MYYLCSMQSPLSYNTSWYRDSKQKYGSGRTKTYILVETLVSDYSNYFGSQMQNQPFSVATDGSNDMDNMNAISSDCYF